MGRAPLVIAETSEVSRLRITLDRKTKTGRLGQNVELDTFLEKLLTVRNRLRQLELLVFFMLDGMFRFSYYLIATCISIWCRFYLSGSLFLNR